MQLLEDRICGGGPLGLVGDQREEALDLVEPGAIGRDEVHVPARPSRTAMP